MMQFIQFIVVLLLTLTILTLVSLVDSPGMHSEPSGGIVEVIGALG